MRAWSRANRRGYRQSFGPGRKRSLPPGPSYLADGPPRRCPGPERCAEIDAGTKTIHAAYKDLRRRNRFTTDFRPTPYDVWSFRHDRAFGIPYPGSIPPAIVAHALHYFCPPGGLVVDPMAGGGTTLDVCQSMGRRCFAYDLEPSRPDIHRHDIRAGFPAEAAGCNLIFCDPPYHTMLARSTGLTVSPRPRGRTGSRFFTSWRATRLPRCARRLPGAFAGSTDRERPTCRVWLPGSRLFWLHGSTPSWFFAGAAN